MCVSIMCHFTMEPFEIAKESKRNIVPKIIRFIENPSLKDSKCGKGKNFLSYCEQDIVRAHICHGCGGYLCLKHRRLMRTRRGCGGVPYLSFFLDIYSMQSLPAKATMRKMYSMNDTLNGERDMSSPKKDNMFHSVFNALNILWEQVFKVPASFIASINYPLSVTVVNNEGVIPHDFFKNLTSRKEPSSTDSTYVRSVPVNESLNIVGGIHNDIFNENIPYRSTIFNENIKDHLKFNYKYGDGNKEDARSDKKESVKENIEYNKTNHNYLGPAQHSNNVDGEELFEYICFNTDIQKVYTNKNCCNFENLCSKTILNEEQFSDSITPTVDVKTILSMETSFSTFSSNILNVQSVQQNTVSNLLTNMLQKVFVGMTDRFCRTDSVESDMAVKRSFSPKQRKKLNTVAKGRGRGRGRSQLRRSGVSQTRHRKERTKHDIIIDIENDFKSWQELKMYDREDNTELEDCFSLDEDTVDEVDTVQYVIEETMHPLTYTIADIQPKAQKPKARRNVDQGMCKFTTKMRSIPECTEETIIFDQHSVESRYNFQKNAFRPRLISESSIDSEDSYCIVFETGSEVTYTSDLEDSEESDIDQTNDDEEPNSPVQKVKFNLNPVVHVMVQWDYAYRAARKGPWEQMARDRERFKGRINCIARVLNPILTIQHRTHIWQERFALTE